MTYNRREMEKAWTAYCEQESRERADEGELTESLNQGDLEGARIAYSALNRERDRGLEVASMLDAVRARAF